MIANSNGGVGLPKWAEELFRPYPYKVAYGGRGSGKTQAVGIALVTMAAQRRMRVACLREHQKSIKESAKRVLESWIEKLGLSSMYDIQQDYILGKNGSLFFFMGLSKVSEEDIKGLEDVDVAWVEEAHVMSERSFEILLPTIRKEGSEVWFTFNPRYRHDVVYRNFIINPRPGAFIKQVNFTDNPWFTTRLEEQRRYCEEFEPERYAHIWLGEPDDEGSTRKVLPYGLLKDCIQAVEKGVVQLIGSAEALTGRVHVGFDVADTGADRNALVARRGPMIFAVDSWRAPTIGTSTRRVDGYCRTEGAKRVFYDAGGLGAGVRSHLKELPHRPYSSYPINFGGAVDGKEVEFVPEIMNEDHFANKGAQMAWSLRLRAQNTRRLLEAIAAGEKPKVRGSKCLFIDPKIPGLEKFLAQLTQPEWEENTSGKIKVDKTPEDSPSPDMYDAAALSYAWDSEFGLIYRYS